MSDLGLLSYKYQALAELARRLRRNVLLIKRYYYGLPSSKKDNETDIQKAVVEFQEIAAFLKEVIELDDENAWPAKWLDEPPLPSVLVEQLRKTHKLDMPLYIKDLARLEKRVQDIASMKEQDIVRLEEIAYTASVDANSVFRKLMRWE